MSNNGAVAVGANDVLFAGNYANGQITRYAADGTSLGVFATAPTSLVGLAFDATGNLFTASAGAEVHKFSATGQDLGVFVTGQSDAEGIVVNAAGELLVVNRGNQTVRRYSATGQDLGFFATSANGLTDPNGIAVDVAGNVYVGNHSGGGTTSVRKFSPMVKMRACSQPEPRLVRSLPIARLVSPLLVRPNRKVLCMCCPLLVGWASCFGGGVYFDALGPINDPAAREASFGRDLVHVGSLCG